MSYEKIINLNKQKKTFLNTKILIGFKMTVYRTSPGFKTTYIHTIYT